MGATCRTCTDGLSTTETNGNTLFLILGSVFESRLQVWKRSLWPFRLVKHKHRKAKAAKELEFSFNWVPRQLSSPLLTVDEDRRAVSCSHAMTLMHSLQHPTGTALNISWFRQQIQRLARLGFPGAPRSCSRAFVIDEECPELPFFHDSRGGDKVQCEGM